MFHFKIANATVLFHQQAAHSNWNEGEGGILKVTNRGLWTERIPDVCNEINRMKYLTTIYDQKNVDGRSILLIDTFNRFVSSIFFCDTMNDSFSVSVSYSSTAIDFFFFLWYLSESSNRRDKRQIEEDLKNFQTALKESKVTSMPQLSTTFSTLAKVSHAKLIHFL